MSSHARHLPEADLTTIHPAVCHSQPALSCVIIALQHWFNATLQNYNDDMSYPMLSS